MARTYIVGNNLWQPLAAGLDAVLVPIPEKRMDGAGVHDFLIENFSEEIGCLVLHADANPQLCMTLAFHVRLTPSLSGSSYLCPIVFVTSLPHENLLKQGVYSQIFLTEKVEICAPHQLAENLPHYSPLLKESYRSDFLDRVNVPRPEGNNHSLANQWGASRVYELVTGETIPESGYKDFNNVQKELYYKYILQRITRTTSITSEGLEYRVKNSALKRVLLIDDEADKGWTKAVEKLFPEALFNPEEDVISERVHSYEDLSLDAKSKIRSGEYDLILLDLRLGGVSEDKIVDPREMSGYKVLKKIKEFNRGNQVIMLTASNKAWNLKALLDPCEGASGYFVKESPEYEFTDEFSSANIQSLLSDAQLCFERSYLRGFYRFIQDIHPGDDEFMTSLKSQLEMAFNMACLAKDYQSYNYAFISMAQVGEVITSSLTGEMAIDGDRKELWFKNQNDGTLIERCKGLKRTGILYELNEDRFMVTDERKKSISQKDKMTCLFLQKWSNEDLGLMHLFGQLTQIRNAFIHKDNASRFDANHPITAENFSTSPDFKDYNLVYSDSSFRNYLFHAASEGYLYIDTKTGHFAISRDINRSCLGLKLFSMTLMRIIENLN